MNIDEIKERLKKATARPWGYSVENGTDQPATLYGQDGGEEIDIAEFEVWDSELHAPEQVANAEFIVNAPADIKALIEAVEAAEKKQHEIWDALKSQTKELARAYDKIETTKERIEIAIDYLPESPNKAMSFLKVSE